MTAKVYNGLVRISLVFAWLCLWLVVQLIRIYRIAFNRRRAAKSKPTVLVIGGGFAGSLIAAELEQQFRVVLVDNKDYVEFTPSVPRALIHPFKLQEIQVRHQFYLRDESSSFIHGSVDLLDVANRQAILENGDCLAYDYVAICTGSSYTIPFKHSSKRIFVTSRADVMANAHSELRASSSVCVIGGGATGVEMAAEIACAYPNINVSLVHHGSRLIPRSTIEASNYVLAFLSSHRVRLLLNDKLELPTYSDSKKHDAAVSRPRGSSSLTLTTERGEQVMADVVLLCVGITQANSRLLRNIPGALDSSGFVRANRFLQLICEPDNSVNDSTPHKSVRPVNAQLSTLAQGAQHVFVAGDVSFGTEERTAQAAQARARVVSQNIRLLHARQTLSTTENKSQLVTASGPGLIEYLPNPKPMIVSLGPWDGVLTYKGWTIKGFIPAVLKEVVEWKCMSSYWYYTPLPF